MSKKNVTLNKQLKELKDKNIFLEQQLVKFEIARRQCKDT